MRIKTVLMTLAAAFVCNVCVMAQAVSPQGELTPEEQEDVNGLIERLENDDDVVNVFHNMA